jgi:hypothetical protein
MATGDCGAAPAVGNGGSVEELFADGVTIRTSHTAMRHTETGATRYERPPGLLALHAEDRRLVASRVELDVAGSLLFVADGLVFEGVTVKGGLRWRRE